MVDFYVLLQFKNGTSKCPHPLNVNSLGRRKKEREKNKETGMEKGRQVIHKFFI